MIGPKQRFLSDIARHSEETDIYDPGGIRTRSPSKGAVADPCFRLRGDQDQQQIYIPSLFRYM